MSTETSHPASQQNGRLMIVDTDTLMCELLQFRFENEGFETVLLHDGTEALKSDFSQVSLIMVDLMNCEFNGLKFTQSIKRNPETFNIPVIILSSKSSEDDIVDGLDAGADDYIAKPFSSRELIARVRSVLRRKRMMSARRASNVVRYKDLVLDLGAGTAYIDGEPLTLTRTEYLILALFMRNRNQFYERLEIRHEAWEDETGISDRAVDTNISRLRKKLGGYGKNIVNRQGFGYGFVE